MEKNGDNLVKGRRRQIKKRGGGVLTKFCFSVLLFVNVIRVITVILS